MRALPAACKVLAQSIRLSTYRLDLSLQKGPLQPCALSLAWVLQPGFWLAAATHMHSFELRSNIRHEHQGSSTKERSRAHHHPSAVANTLRLAHGKSVVAEQDVEAGLLTYKITHAASLGELQRLADHRVEVMNAIHVAALAARAVELGAISNPEGAKHLLDQCCPLLLQPQASDWTFRELVDVLWAYGKLRHMPSRQLEAELLVPLLAQGLPMPMSVMSSRELAKMATACSMMRRRDSLTWTTLHEACLQKMRKFDARSLSAMLEAFATVPEHCSELLQKRAAEHAHNFLPDFSPADLSRTLQALARLKCTDAAFISKLADQIRQQVTEFMATDILRVLAALRELRDEYESERCIGALAKAARKQVDLFAPSELVQLVQLFHSLQCGDADVYSAISGRLTSYVPELPPAHLVAGATALSAAGCRDQRLYTAMLAELAAASDMDLQQQGQLLHACNNAGITSMTVTLQVLERAMANADDQKEDMPHLLEGWSSLMGAVRAALGAFQDAQAPGWRSLRLVEEGEVGRRQQQHHSDRQPAQWQHGLTAEQTQHLLKLLQHAAHVIAHLLACKQHQLRRHETGSQRQQRQTITAAAASVVCHYAAMRYFDATLWSSACDWVLAKPQVLSPSQVADFVQALGSMAPALHAHGRGIGAAQRTAVQVLLELRGRRWREMRAAAAAVTAPTALEAGPGAGTHTPGLGLTPQQAASVLVGAVQLQLGVGLLELPLRHILFDLTAMPSKVQDGSSKAGSARNQASDCHGVSYRQAQTPGSAGLQKPGQQQDDAATSDSASELTNWQAAEVLQAMEVLALRRQAPLMLPDRAWQDLKQLAVSELGLAGRGQTGQSSSSGSTDISRSRLSGPEGSVLASAGWKVASKCAEAVAATFVSLGYELQQKQAAPASYFLVSYLAHSPASTAVVPTPPRVPQGSLGCKEEACGPHPPTAPQGASRQYAPPNAKQDSGGEAPLTAVDIVHESECTLSQPRQLLGPVAMRHQFLKQLGYQVLAVHEITWAALKTDHARKQYLLSKLQAVQHE